MMITEVSDMGMSQKQRILVETVGRRDEAEALLRALVDAKASSEKNLAEIRQSDFLKKVTGRSSMDNAIASTQRLIESFNRVITDLKSNLSDEDLELLGGLEGAAIPTS